MKIQFNLNYKTQFGQRLKIVGNIPALGNNKIENAKTMFSKNGNNGDWDLIIDIADNINTLKYKYLFYNSENSNVLKEFGDFRQLDLKTFDSQQIIIRDFWRPNNNSNNVLFSSAFTNAVFKQKIIDKSNFVKKQIIEEEQIIRFNIRVSRVEAKQKIGLIVYNDTKVQNFYNFNNKNYPFWTTEISFSKNKMPTAYKYCIFDVEQNKIIIEETKTRYFNYPTNSPQKFTHITNDEDFKFPKPWKGIGVAVPVFSLRTKNSFGVGEFLDLKNLVDWSKKNGLKMIQILPINDTTANYTWHDSYPYSAISVFALHPIYLNLEKVGNLNSEILQEIVIEQKKLFNKKTFVDYEPVIKAKVLFLKRIFVQQKKEFFKNSDYIDFFNNNKDWLVPYAVFSFLRDTFGTIEFDKWGRFSKASKNILEELSNETSEYYFEIAFHYFTQFHLHKQLLEVANYARNNGIVLKGDIPIGILRNSVDAWYEPELYNLEGQAGAPPDDFAVEGQNWKFPTYNWELMKKDNYKWWRRRLIKLSAYFDAYRIDHILGFFRIWEIPKSQTQGIMGYFNPALSLTVEELQQKDFNFNFSRYCTPYIREHIIKKLFNNLSERIKKDFLNKNKLGEFQFKQKFNSQLKIELALPTGEQIAPEERKINLYLKKGLKYLISEVLFIVESESENRKLHPRHSLFNTWSYKELDDNSKQKIKEIYNDYFYHRNEEFWKKQAMQKLPALKNATEMLVCGEDLGMVPACVPDVMNDLNMLSLEVQRMPKNPNTEFGNTKQYPYLSVATPSSHDTSTIREWWEEDKNRTQKYYNQVLKKQGKAPTVCEPEIVSEIIKHHINSPSIWSVFPIQDILATNKELRLKNPKEERINVPANPQHFWKYRLHLDIDEIKNLIFFKLLVKK